MTGTDTWLTVPWYSMPNGTYRSISRVEPERHRAIELRVADDARFGGDPEIRQAKPTILIHDAHPERSCDRRAPRYGRSAQLTPALTPRCGGTLWPHTMPPAARKPFSDFVKAKVRPPPKLKKLLCFNRS